MKRCLYQRWADGDEKALNRFTVTIFTAYGYADGTNKWKIRKTWPEWFEEI